MLAPKEKVYKRKLFHSQPFGIHKVHFTSSVHNNEHWFLQGEALRESKSLDALILSTYEYPFDEVKNPDPKPAPYTIALTMDRVNRVTNEPDTDRPVQVCHFSGEVKPGGYLRIRLDAFVKEFMSDLDGTTPFNLFVNVHIRGSRSYQVEYANTASADLNIGFKEYELVSKEILSLFSPYFEARYYGSLAAIQPQVLHAPFGYDKEDFLLAMRMLLHWMHYRTLPKVTPENAPLLISFLERYQFPPIYKYLDAHLAQFCLRSQDYKMWDTAMLLSQEHPLPETARIVPSLYKTLWARVGQTCIPQRLFDAYDRGAQNSSMKGCCLIYLQFKSGEAIVQLNRVGAPLTTAAMLETFPLGSSFFWDNKGRLVSCDPVPAALLHKAEHVDQSSVRDGAWAFLIRTRKNHSEPHYMLTKSRPDGLYLGFVVEGAEHLNKNETCWGAGLHFLAK